LRVETMRRRVDAYDPKLPKPNPSQNANPRHAGISTKESSTPICP
jgi:hypothetical protein